QADFCVRNGDFEIAKARGCPTSQQVQFTAVKPSESPKGPMVNLVEEADYDDVQARLAGIQRLLAGCSANRGNWKGATGPKSTISRMILSVFSRTSCADHAPGMTCCIRTASPTPAMPAPTSRTGDRSGDRRATDRAT